VLAGSLGLSLLAGHLQFAAYLWLTTALYALARTVYRWSTRRPAPVLALLLAAALGLGMGLPQLLPSLELGRYSPRGETKVSAQGWDFQQQRALQPVELLTFVSPYVLGDPVTGTYPLISYTEHCAWAGVLALLLAVLGVALRRDRWAALYGIGAVAALSIALAGPLAKLLYYGLPALGQTGGFARILGVYTLCLAVLAGLGLEALLTAVARRERADSPTLPVGASVGVGAALILAVAVELFPWGWRFLPLARPAQVYPETALTRLLEDKGKDPNYRVLCITPRENWSLTHVPEALLPPNAATVYGWYSPDGYDSLYLASYRTWAVKAEEGADVSPLANGNMMLLGYPESTFLDYTGVGLVASLTSLGASDWLMNERMADGTYVYDRPTFPVVDPGTPRGEAALTACSLATLSATVRSGGRRLAVEEAWYPGWRAYADGRPLPGSPNTGGPCMMLSLPADAHQVWLAFYPETVVVGLFLGLFSLALVAGIVAVSAGRRRA
jgi:hypothetical protein